MDDLLPLAQFEPQSQLVVDEHHVDRPRFPAIDAHNHLSYHAEEIQEPAWQLHSPAELIEAMDRQNIRAIVDLDGSADRLPRAVERYRTAYPARVAILALLDWSVCTERHWPELLARQLSEALARGADGLKISKGLGLRYRDESGSLIRVDDPRLAELWAVAAGADAPVLIHTADPVAFFRPLDRFNERWDELHLRPEWSWYGPDFPSFGSLMEQLLGLVANNPRTTFQIAHVGSYAENLGWVAETLLRPHPNVYVDISERIAELGRQPHAARRFLIDFQDRVVFGTDRPPLGPWYPYYFRFLETMDDYLPHGPEVPPRQGRWNIHGVGLPDDVLRKIYCDNALRLYSSLRG